MSSILTVVTPATSRDLTNLSTVKTRLGVCDNDSDSTISALIRESGDFISSYCNRIFPKDKVSQTIRLGQSAAGIPLTRFPVGVVESVTENGTVLDPADYEVNNAGIISRLEGDEVSWWPPGKVTVVYFGGYDIPTGLPRDLEHACIRMVTLAFMAASRDPMVRQEDVPGVGSVSYWVGTPSGASTTGLPPDVTSTLDQYRCMSFA